MSGITSQREIPTQVSRKALQEQLYLGDPEQSATCPDGRRVETYQVRQRVYTSKDVTNYLVGMLDYFLPVLLEPVLTPLAIIESERAKLPVAFVYGPDDLVLYWYVVSDSPQDRFMDARRQLAYAVEAQLDQEAGPAWSAILTSFAGEARQRAACVGYVFTLIDEANLLQALTLATEVDEGRLAKEGARSNVQACIKSVLDSPCAAEPR